MRIRLKERQTYGLNKSGQIASAKLLYRVNEIGTATDAEILAAVRDAAPGSLGGVSARDSVELSTLPSGDCRDVAVNYTDASSQRSVIEAKETKRAGDESWTFDATGGSAHIDRGTKIRSVYRSGSFALTEFGGMVGWNGKHGEALECSGVDVVTPSMCETCVKTLAAADVTTAFRRSLMAATGKVNNAAFHGWESGEVLFTGASCSAEYKNDLGNTLVDVTYSFSIRENETGYSVDDLTVSAEVEGWDYVWTIWGFDAESQVSKVQIVAVSRVYKRTDLNSLGIGGV